MNENRFCIVYRYKGASNDYIAEGYNSFFKTEFEMCEFLDKIKGNPAQYRLVSIFRVEFDEVPLEQIDEYRKSHEGEKEFRAAQRRAKIVMATGKLNSALTPEEIGLLKDEKII